MNDKTVVRTGYGIFYGNIGAYATTSNLAGFSQSTPMQPTSDNGLTFPVKLSNPLPNGLLAPLGPAGGLSTNLGQAISYYATDRKPPYSQRWSLGLQRQLRGGFVVEATYVGSRATHLRREPQHQLHPGVVPEPAADRATPPPSTSWARSSPARSSD